MKYLVTGGAGFIGSHIVEELINKNKSVVILDNFTSGKKSNIAQYEKTGEIVECIKGSIEDLTLLKKICLECDGIFHEAAIVSVPDSVANPLKTHKVNCTGTLNLLIAARDAGIKPVVIASSSAVYGDTIDLPQNETVTPRPLSPYAVSKLTGEYYSKVFSELFGMKITNLRYFNVYGPRQDPLSEYAAVIPRFITKILHYKPITIYGDGNQTRDFVYVKDVVNANLNAMKYQSSGIINVAYGQETSVNYLAKIIGELTGQPITVNSEQSRTGDIQRSVADIHLAKTLLHFKPEYDIKRGLKDTIKWFGASKIN